MDFNGKEGSEKGSKKGLSRRHLEGRNTPFREYDPVGVRPIKGWFWRILASFRFSFRGNMRTYPHSGFRSAGTSECTLVPGFVPGKHLPKPPFLGRR